MSFLKLFFDYDPKISSIFLTQYQKGLRNFFIIAVIGYITYAFLDFFNKYYFEVFLRSLIILFCLVPVIVNLRKMELAKMRLYSNLSLFLIFILEIETQMNAPDIEFYNSTAWFADILIMLIHSMYFLGTPGQYCIYWFILVSYYILRVTMTVQGEIHHAIIYHVATWLFGTSYNFWWFRIRYESTINDKLLKEEYEKRVSLEKELSKIKERESIFADIHDNLGGKILDLSLLLSKISPNVPVDKASKENIDSRMIDIQKTLRSQIFDIEDMNSIEADFAIGLRFFIVRRYTSSGRKIQFNVSDDFKEEFLDKAKYKQILSIVHELINNDLKYGEGESEWRLATDESFVIFQLSSHSKYQEILPSPGTGRKTIPNRAESISAMYFDSLENGIYNAELRVGKKIF